MISLVVGSVALRRWCWWGSCCFVVGAVADVEGEGEGGKEENEWEEG